MNFTKKLEKRRRTSCSTASNAHKYSYSTSVASFFFFLFVLQRFFLIISMKKDTQREIMVHDKKYTKNREQDATACRTWVYGWYTQKEVKGLCHFFVKWVKWQMWLVSWIERLVLAMAILQKKTRILSGLLKCSFFI